MKRNDDATCSTCLYYSPHANIDREEVGQCRRVAPSHRKWRVVRPANWCGEHPDFLVSNDDGFDALKYVTDALAERRWPDCADCERRAWYNPKPGARKRSCPDCDGEYFGDQSATCPYCTTARNGEENDE